ncbi:hypothetical protein I4U23_012117 [Adineta vaga]|nr:hypothetical protein I4U23_012117 [Adineta vaga]
MNENTTSFVSTLETLPDELFYDIFDYLSVRDLYDGFYNLNERFASILATLSNLYGDITIKEETHSLAFRFFASRIVILNVKHVDSLDLSSFSALRSLSLYAEPNRDQCQSIQQFLPLLQSFSTCKPPVQYFCYSVSSSHFVFTNAYPSLRSCCLNLIPFKDKQQWTNVSSLRIINVRISEPRVYPQILHCCPSLIRLQLEFIRHFARPPKSFCEFASHLSLRYFELRLDCTTYSYGQIIDVLLSLVPNLKHFSLFGSLSDVNDINIDSLADILHRHVPYLDRFYFTMAIQESLSLILFH